jgi:hypothetical protein
MLTFTRPLFTAAPPSTTYRHSKDTNNETMALRLTMKTGLNQIFSFMLHFWTHATSLSE